MQYLLPSITFFLGASVGSFVCVVASRYNTGLAFWKGESFCFSCNSTLKTLDLVPLLSFLTLKGRCRYCGSKIPKDTFIIELAMGLLSILAALKVGLFSLALSWLFIGHYLLLLIIFAVILLITLYDFRHFIIPDSFLLVLLGLSACYFFLFVSRISYLAPLVSGASLALPFLLLFLVSRGKWLGLGDVKYIAVLGVLLGFAEGLSAVILGFWIGAVYALLALFVLKKNITMKSEIPFGPFLSMGIIASLYFSIDLFHLHDLFQIF